MSNLQSSHQHNSVAIARVPLGETAQTRIISRCDVANGSKGRVIPIFKDVACIGTIYSDEPKGTFLCNNDQALAIGKSPRYYYVLPVFRLNTDSKGIPKEGDISVKLEYLRFSVTQYEAIAAKMDETEKVTSLAIKKVEKKVDGKDYSYIEPIVSTKEVSADLLKKCDELRASLNEDQIWGLVIADIARPFSEYLKVTKTVLEEPGNHPSSQASINALPPSQVANPADDESFSDDKDEFEED